MADFIHNNPALFYSFTIGLSAAIIAVVVAAGVPVSPPLLAAIDGLIVIVASIIIGFVTRGKVVPFQNVLEYRTLGDDGKLSNVVLSGPANDMRAPGEDIRQITPDYQTEPNNERF